MATVVNFIDTTLQAAAARGVNLPTADIQLLPSAWLFKVNADGSITPETITFTATPVDLDAQAFTFNATGAPMTGITAKSVTVAGADVTGSSVTVIASAVINGRTYTKPCTIQKLQDGVVGSTTYTWIKYADSAAGAGLSDDPNGKAYIGMSYNKPSPIESTIASDYTWSLIKGTDGQPGPPGEDGVQLYTWIKYADYANGDGMYDLPTTSTLYIGISVNKTTPTESNNPTDYVWSRFKGDQGVPGPALYTWIKYGDSAVGAGLSDDPTNKAYIGFAYNKTTPVESENPADYTWSLNQGGQGVPGQPGKDGTTYYTWIKYADVPDGTGLYDVPTDSTVYIGIAVNKVTATESTNKADYTWSRFKGGQGVPGNPGQPGQRGTVDISAGTAGSVWSDSEATAAIAQTGYGVPQMLDVVTLYNQAAGFANTRYWNGSAWIPVAQVINGSLLVKNTVAADKIDARGLSIKDAQGNVILAAGSALPAAYAAPGTLNSDIKVGGRNLYPDSSFERGQHSFAVRNGVGSIQLSNIVGTTGGAKAFFMDGGDTDMYVYTGTNMGVLPGKTYTVSFDYKCATTSGSLGSSCTILLKAADGTWLEHVPIQPVMTPDQVWRRFEKTFTFRADAYLLEPRFGIATTGVYSWFAVDNLKIEEGTKATAWTPAIEDTDADVVKAGTTAQWPNVGGVGKPQDNATVGAPSGTMVGGTDAGLVASRALNGDSAYNALPGITQQISDKLSKTSATDLAARITLQTGGAILAGTPANGSYHDATGFYGVQGGVVKLAVPVSGDPTFGGKLTAAYGTFGALRIAAGGFIAQGSFDGSWAWPTSGGGFLFHANGVLFGNRNDANSGFFSVGANGNIEAPGLTYAGRQLTLSNPVIVQPQISNPNFGTFTVSLGGDWDAGGSGKSISLGSRTATITGGTDPKTINWTVQNGVNSSAAATISISSGQGTATITLRSATGSVPATGSAILTCTVTSANNLTTTTSINVTSTHG